MYAIVFLVTVTEDGFIPSKIQKKAVLVRYCLFSSVVTLAWIVLHFLCTFLMFAFFFLYRLDVLGKLRNHLAGFAFFNGISLDFWVHLSCLWW